MRGLLPTLNSCSGALLLAIAMGALGCSKSHAATQAQPPVAQARPLASAPVAHETHGQGHGRIPDCVVFVDGKPSAVLRHGELPPGLKASTGPRPPNTRGTSRFFRLYDWVEAMGIDVKKLRALHFYGSHNRVAMIDGDELARFKDRLIFDFTQAFRGKPRQRWSTEGLRVPTGIDVFSSVAIYVDKAPPQYREADEELLLDGKPVEDVPYVEGELPKGTRVYVDGKLVGWVKRRYLSDKLVVNPGEAGARFSVGRYLQSFGVDLATVKAADLTSGDDLAYRMAPIDLKDKDAIVFTMANRMKGKVKMHLPNNKAARISSIEVYVHAAPPPSIRTRIR